MSIVTFQQNTICKLKGNEINVGDEAPVVNVINSNPMLHPERIGGYDDIVQLIIVIPSIDTDVCDAEVRMFNYLTSNLKGVEVITVSMDLPFASTKWCGVTGVDKVKVCSDFKDREFGNSYGTVISDGPLEGLLTRSIFIIGKDKKIFYKQIVPEITDEPDYDEALDYLKEAICNF